MSPGWTNLSTKARPSTSVAQNWYVKFPHLLVMLRLGGVGVAVVLLLLDVELLVVVEDVEEVLRESSDLYILRRLPAPQYSVPLPWQTILQSIDGAGTEPAAIVLPQSWKYVLVNRLDSECRVLRIHLHIPYQP